LQQTRGGEKRRQQRKEQTKGTKPVLALRKDLNAEKKKKGEVERIDLIYFSQTLLRSRKVLYVQQVLEVAGEGDR